MQERNIDVSLRTVNIKDAEAVLEIEREVLSESEFMVSVIEEFEETSEQIKSWIHKILENKRETLIVAETKGKLVGFIVFRSKKYQKTFSYWFFYCNGQERISWPRHWKTSDSRTVKLGGTKPLD